MAWTAPRTWVVGEVPDASLMNLHLRDNLLYLAGEVAWTAPALTNGWVNFDGGTQFTAAGYRKIGDLVFLKGLIKTGTINTAAFTLPVGYRPPANSGVAYGVASNDLFGVLVINPSGTVVPTNGSNVWFQLDGVMFSTI
jgi:hypothetical protein